jgi:Fe-S cluster assembly protein SufD
LVGGIYRQGTVFLESGYQPRGRYDPPLPDGAPVTPLEPTPAAGASAQGPDWLLGRREEAAARFEDMESPSSTDEVWKYLDLDFAIEDFSAPLGEGHPASPDPLRGAVSTELAATLVDGSFSGGEDGDRAALVSLQAAVEQHADLVRSSLEALPIRDRFAVAADAFAADGAVVWIAKGTARETPIYIDVESATSGAATFPTVVVVLEEAAAASVVIHLRSDADVHALAVPRIMAAVGPAGRLDLTVVQRFGYAMRSLGQAHVIVDRDASLRFTEVGIGGKLSRLRLDTDLVGRGAEAQVVGAYFGEQDQTLDYRYFMNHIGSDTRSDMFLKGAVEDEALSVFTGLIRIEETGQRTEAFQTNRNLILSEGASAQSVPNLEILANDVKCGHGSTVGPLDEEQRYYLLSRGLDREQADRLQVRGFFEEAIARMPDASVAGPVRSWINDKYVTAQQQGRV